MACKTLPEVSPTLNKDRRQHFLISHRERDDLYKGVVIQFTSRWRLIVCKDQIQWILQKREKYHGGNWKGQRYMTTKASVIKACGTLELLANPKISKELQALPNHARDYSQILINRATPKRNDGYFTSKIWKQQCLLQKEG